MTRSTCLFMYLLATQVPVGEGVPDGGQPLLPKLLFHRPLDCQPVELETPAIRISKFHSISRLFAHHPRPVRNCNY